MALHGSMRSRLHTAQRCPPRWVSTAHAPPEADIEAAGMNITCHRHSCDPMVSHL